MEKTGRDDNSCPRPIPMTKPARCTGEPCWNRSWRRTTPSAPVTRSGVINAVLQHPEEPWMLANLDREVIGAPDVQILECKTAGINGARLWKEGVPEYVQLQVMHQLAVTGKQAADVAVLIGGQELQVHRIERDEGMIARLIELERQFWRTWRPIRHHRPMARTRRMWPCAACTPGLRADRLDFPDDRNLVRRSPICWRCGRR